MKSPDLLPSRPQRARDTHRELRTGSGTDSREAATRPGRFTGPTRGIRVPSLVQLAFAEPLPSDYYLG